MDIEERVLGGFYGAAIGDALGVPVEFKKRDFLKENPVQDLMGYGCWKQPLGTFSDDSSMLFCTAQSLLKGYDLKDIAANFVKWYQEGYWGAHDEVFDIGRTTRRSLNRIMKGVHPKFSGDFEEENNGNGSLMRILPMVFFLKNETNIQARYEYVKEVSSITHAHFRSVFSCFICVEYGRILLEGKSLKEGYILLRNNINSFVKNQDFNAKEVSLFDRVIQQNIAELPESSLSSWGYVLDSLESSFWCLLTSSSYEESVLKAVNLGGDTDTTATITGGLAGLYYGKSHIKEDWIQKLVKTEEIRKLSEKLGQKLFRKL